MAEQTEQVSTEHSFWTLTLKTPEPGDRGGSITMPLRWTGTTGELIRHLEAFIRQLMAGDVQEQR